MINNILKTVLNNSFLGWQQPRHLILHVTSRCNARCGMCFAWQRLNKNKDLSLKEIEKIAKTLKNLIFLDISGGEPFLRDDLEEILAIFEKYSPDAYINLPTNCLSPDKIEAKTIEILRKTKLPISLNLSLDGLQKTHDKIRGVKGSFDKVLLTFEKLKKIKAKESRLSLKVSTCISNQNFTEIEKLTGFVQKEMKGIDFHTLILIRGNPRNKEFSLPSLAELVKKKELFLKTWEFYGYGKNLGWFGDKIGNISHGYFLNLYLKTLREKKMALPCLAGKAHAVIFANGDLAFCELLKPIGNLCKVNFNFQKLWFSAKAEEQRKKISQHSCFCTHGCVWTDNVFFNPKAYPQLAREFLKKFDFFSGDKSHF